MGCETWHPGVLGIVASRLVQKYNKPAVLVSWSGSAGKASARTAPGIDIYKAIKSSSNPSAFIQAQIDFAKTHNAANTEAILKWADEMEKEGQEIPEDIAKIVKFYRIQSGSQL